MERVFDLVETEQAEVENTTTESAMAQTEFPAHFWKPGKVVRFEGACLVNDNNGTDTLTCRARFGTDGATLTNDDELGATDAVDVADGDIGVVRGTLVCRDLGDGTYQLVAQGVISDPDASGALVNDFADVGTAFDPGVATYLSYSAEWSVAHADDEVAAISWLVTELCK